MQYPPSLAATDAMQKAERVQSELISVRHDLGRLFMIAEVLWTMVREQHGYSDEELFRRVMEVDLRDGRADGQVAPGAPEPCPHCGRLNRPGRAICIYCGKARMVNPFAR